MYGPNRDDPSSQEGYSSQIGLFEMMLVEGRVRDAIARNAQTAELNSIAKEEGMIDFQEAGLINVAKGRSSLEEVMRILPQMD